MVDIGWREAEACLQAEARWLERAAESVDAAEYDNILGSAPDVEEPDDYDALFRNLDVGVAGLVMVISAAGYATCYSCRGHADVASKRVPQVRFNTDQERLRLLAEKVRTLGCGLDAMDDDYGLATVYAPSVPDLHRLATVVLDDRLRFDALTPPPWRARVFEATAEGEYFEWRDDELK